MDKYAFDHELQVHDAEQFRVSDYEQEHEHQRKFFQPIFFLTSREIYRSIRHYRGWQFIPLVLFVLVLVLVLSETVLVLEEKYRDFVDKIAKYWVSSFTQRVIELNRLRRFRVRVRVPRG